MSRVGGNEKWLLLDKAIDPELRIRCKRALVTGDRMPKGIGGEPQEHSPTRSTLDEPNRKASSISNSTFVQF